MEIRRIPETKREEIECKITRREATAARGEDRRQLPAVSRRQAAAWRRRKERGGREIDNYNPLVWKNKICTTLKVFYFFLKSLTSTQYAKYHFTLQKYDKFKFQLPLFFPFSLPNH